MGYIIFVFLEKKTETHYWKRGRGNFQYLYIVAGQNLVPIVVKDAITAFPLLSSLGYEPHFRCELDLSFRKH